MRTQSIETQQAIAQLRPMKHDDLPSLTIKDQQRRDIERDVERFLQAGHSINRADEVPSFVWPLSRDARQLVSIANFSYKYSIRQPEIMAAIRRRELTAWVFRGELHLLSTKAYAWQRNIKSGVSK